MYKFYGNDNCDVKPINKEFEFVKNPKHMYDLLSNIWSIDTCAPRLRSDWSINNKTLGQCSITAFLVQDIFGGDVYGVKLNDGNFHCYNVVGNAKFDLTSEQFDYALNYDNNPIQSREIHFSKEEKYQRYLLLKKELLKYFK